MIQEQIEFTHSISQIHVNVQLSSYSYGSSVCDTVHDMSDNNITKEYRADRNDII